MRLYHNTMSLNVYRNYSKSVGNQSKSVEKISNGYKVNSAYEDPNALAKSETMRMQIRGMQMSQRNLQDGISMLQSLDGSLDKVNSVLNRIRELVVQAGGAGADDDKKSIENEIDEMKNTLNNIIAGSDFNEVNLVNGTIPGGKEMVCGSLTGEKITIPTINLKPDKLGLTSIDIKNNLGDSIETIDKAISMVVSARSEYGAIQNRLESTYEISSENQLVSGKAESELRDLDVAEEMINFSRNNILIEAGNAMMAQTNRFPQDILRILENVRSR